MGVTDALGNIGVVNPLQQLNQENVEYVKWATENIINKFTSKKKNSKNTIYQHYFAINSSRIFFRSFIL